MRTRTTRLEILVVIFLMPILAYGAVQPDPKKALECTGFWLDHVFFDIGVKTDSSRAKAIRDIEILVAATPWMGKCQDLAKDFMLALKAAKFHFLQNSHDYEDLNTIRLACYRTFGALYQECLQKKNSSAEAIVRRGLE